MSNKDILNEEREEAIVDLVSNIDWKRKLTSRKFWLSVCAFVVLILIACGKTTEEAKQIAAIIMAGATVVAYIIGEGMTDVANAGSDTDIEGFNIEEE